MSEVSSAPTPTPELQPEITLAPPKKKRLGKILLISALILVFLLSTSAAAVFLVPSLNNSFHMLTKTPNAYFRHLQKASTPQLATEISNIYGKAKEAEIPVVNQKAISSYKLDIELSFSAYMLQQMGTQSDKALSIRLAGESTTRNQELALNGSFFLNNKELLKDFAVYFANEKFILRAPDLHEKYLYGSLGSLEDLPTDFEEGIAPISPFDAWSELGKTGITKELVSQIVTEYSLLLIPTIEKSTVTNLGKKDVQIAGEAFSLNVLQAVIPASAQKDTLLSFVRKARGDARLAELANVLFGATKADYEKMLDDAVTSLEEATFDNAITVTLYVNNEGSISGFVLSAPADETSSALSFFNAQKGKKHFQELKVTEAEETVLFVTNSATEATGSYTGKLAIGNKDRSVFTIDYTNVKMEEDIFSGNFKIFIPANEELSLSDSYLIELNANITKQKAELAFKMTMGENELFSASIKTEQLETDVLNIPEMTADNSADIESEEFYNIVAEISQNPRAMEIITEFSAVFSGLMAAPTYY